MSQKCFKFTFFAFLDSLKLSLKFPCTISVIWKRGDKLAEVREKKAIVDGVATFQQQLMIECNMMLDPVKKTFEPKKTIFTVLIFTQKGTKQAGEVEVDVAELLNLKQQEKAYECTLQKCPDKNAKLIFKIRPSFKEEIKPDAVSQRSFNNVDLEKVTGTINVSQANFKKKPKVPEEDQSKSGLLLTAKNVKTQTHIKLPNDDHLKQLMEQNKRLKDQAKESKKESQKTKASIQKAEQSIAQERRICEGYEKEIARLKQISKTHRQLQQENRMLESELLISKLKLAEIFNMAFQLEGPDLADRLQGICGYTQNID